MNVLMTPPTATISEQSQLRLTRKMTGMQIRVQRQRPMIQERMVASGSGRIVAKSGRIHLHPQDIGGQGPQSYRDGRKIHLCDDMSDEDRLRIVVIGRLRNGYGARTVR